MCVPPRLPRGDDRWLPFLDMRWIRKMATRSSVEIAVKQKQGPKSIFDQYDPSRDHWSNSTVRHISSKELQNLEG
jgi:hypothetical protein